jgi:hypothetical protein
MKRLIGIAAAMLFVFILVTPVALAAEASDRNGRVIVSTQGDVTLPADEQADVIVVVEGVATINGQVNTLVTVNGSAVLTGAQVGSIVAVGSDVQLNAGTVVTGDVMTVDSPVDQAADATVQGEITDLRGSLITVGAILAPAFLLFWIGIGLATIVAGLLLAGLASRQVRMAEQVIVREPAPSFVVGLLGLIVIPLVAVALMITIIGAPLGLGILFALWPLVAFVGYLVAGIWVGEWLLIRFRPGVIHERPYLAATIGVLLLQVVALVPVLSLVAVIASLFGFGAVLILAWRTLTTRPGSGQTIAGPSPAPVAS